jgi:hypothetical protein
VAIIRTTKPDGNQRDSDALDAAAWSREDSVVPFDDVCWSEPYTDPYRCSRSSISSMSFW